MTGRFELEAGIKSPILIDYSSTGELATAGSHEVA
jgi:hypothetical protein